METPYTPGFFALPHTGSDVKLFDFSRHFEVYNRLTPISHGIPGDPFDGYGYGDAKDFYSQYENLVNYLYELDLKPIALELSLFAKIESESVNPSYTIVILGSKKQMVKNYRLAVLKNVENQYTNFGPIIHHPQLTSSPFYFKTYSEHVFIDPIAKNFRNVSPYIGKYDFNPAKITDSSYGVLESTIQNFFDEIRNLYRTTVDNINSSVDSDLRDIAILLPLPKVGSSYTSYSRISGGGLFIFGSINKNTNPRNIVIKVSQYLAESLLKQTMLIPEVQKRDQFIESSLSHEIKNSITQNIINNLNQAVTAKEEQEKNNHINVANDYAIKLTNRIQKFLDINKHNAEYITANELRHICEEVANQTHSGIEIKILIQNSKKKIWANKENFRTVIEEAVTNAKKQMNRFWSTQQSSGKKTIFILASNMEDGSHITRFSIFNTGTVFQSAQIERSGSSHPSNRQLGETGWGHIIMYTSLKRMDAAKFNNNKYLLLENTTYEGIEGAMISFQLKNAIE